MVSAIGGTTAPDQLSGGAAAGALQAQLALFQHQLSDCVNCPSSRTPAGKAAIEAIASRISSIKSRIADIDGAKASRQTSARASATHVGPGNAVSNGPAVTGSAGAVGATLNVFA